MTRLEVSYLDLDRRGSPVNRMFFTEALLWLKIMPGPAKSLSKKSLGLRPIDKYLLFGWDEFLFQYGQQFL
jgi:hypothetical protein